MKIEATYLSDDERDPKPPEVFEVETLKEFMMWLHGKQGSKGKHSSFAVSDAIVSLAWNTSGEGVVASFELLRVCLVDDYPC